jgi:DNA (cytosine-5)-methyltransferase 1
MVVDYQLDQLDSRPIFAYPPTLLPGALADIPNIDLFLAGPPCQGHSNLNNHTRRDDPRNQSYLATAATAIAAGARAVVIENVREAIAAKGDPVGTSVRLFEDAGYHVQLVVLDASEYGVAQTRKRGFLIATKSQAESVANVAATMRRPVASALSVIDDLLDVDSQNPFDRPSTPGQETQARINYLFDNDLYELPDSQRPDCHKAGNTYKSVYGRIQPSSPSGTITQGFLTMGRGRFVHPTRRRCLTPHEAARIQCFPDAYQFVGTSGEVLSHRALSKLIGNAVPPRLGELACRVALSSLNLSNG